MGETSKRARVDSEDLEVEPKRGRVDSSELPPVESDDSPGLSSEPVPVPPQEETPEGERVDSDDGDSFEEAYIPDNLLDILYDTEPAEQEAQDLDSVIKSFEEEISAPPTTVSDSGESQPDLGYLLEASDDELGLPPTAASTTSASDDAPSDYSNAPHMYGFPEEISNYEPYGFGFGADSGGVYTSAENDENDGGEFVMFDGLFDSSDYSEFLYRPESMSAS